jgi:hypothetical protein
MKNTHIDEKVDNYLLTPQEHKLIGSTVYEILYQHPHTPIAVQEGASVTKVKMLRAGKTLEVISDFYNIFIEGEMNITVTLEPLGPNGKTIRDPQVLPGKGYDHTKAKPIDDFPYRRAELDNIVNEK